MPHAFLTGLTGFLGRHIADVLLEQGWTVTAMVRDAGAALTEHGNQKALSVVAGDLTDARAVLNAMPEGVDAVFHAAADTSAWRKYAARQRAVNIGGTQAVIDAASARGAGRMVHVSSISVYGHHSTEITEESQHHALTGWVPYAKSKALAEQRVQTAVTGGLDAVIVNPTHIVGRYDTQNWARMILKMVAKDLPGAPPGAGNFASGRAVAEGVVAAYHKGRTSENYILGGPFHTMREFMEIAAGQLGIAPPARTLPAWALSALAQMFSVVAMVSGTQPRITPEEAFFASEVDKASSEKAIRELGYRMVPLEESIAACLETLREKGLLSG